MNLDSQRFHFIIVGAGPAGCVLANRLSSNPANKVLLLEAGSDMLPGHESPAVRDAYPRSYGDPRLKWPDLQAEVHDAGSGAVSLRRFEQARAMGGGSAIMGMLALRGLPADYDDWARFGIRGWGWDDVLPYFKKLERDLDFNGPLHGQSGPLPIRRHAPENYPGFSRAMARSLFARGYSSVSDMNADFQDGVGALPMSNLPKQRVSAAMAYLGAQVRARPNLHIVTDTYVESVIVAQGKATGVQCRRANQPSIINGDEIIVCAGAIYSPALLMRSGIGPGAELQEMGIAVTRDLPGVGKNLQNHPLFNLAVHLKQNARQSKAFGPAFHNGLRYSSNLPGCSASDMFLVILSKTSWHAVGRQIGALGVSVYKSYSRGQVSLDGADPRASPRVRFNLLDDERDLSRLVDGVMLAWDCLQESGVSATINDIFVPTKGALIQALNVPRMANRVRAGVAGRLLDGPTALRRRLLAEVGMNPAPLMRERARLTEFVRERAVPAGHVVGTCRMGCADDQAAVVDEQGRIHGLAGIRVIDGSVLPTIVTANTNIPITMVAEKIADAILATASASQLVHSKENP